MAFTVNSATFDVVSMQASVVAQDNPMTPGPAKTLQITFPYDPAAATERSRLIAAAKKVLQQALNELA
jgi:hypothetical protein